MNKSDKYYNHNTIFQDTEHCQQFKRIIFDICGTLFTQNTTTALLDQIASKGGLQSIQIVFWHVIASAGKRLRIISPEEYMCVRIKGLRGISRQIIAEESKILITHHLTQRKVTTDILSASKRRKIPFGYATFTLYEIAEAVRAKYGGVLLCASELDYNDAGICKGSYKKGLHNYNKETCLPNDWQKELKNTCFITDDSIADKSMLQAVSYPVYLPLENISEPTSTTFLYSFPGVYYYSTRYRTFYECMAHILKFWGTYALTIWLTVPEATHPQYLLPAFIAWLAIYDIGCRRNDINARTEEGETERYTPDYDKSFIHFSMTRLLWASLCLWIIFTMKTSIGFMTGALLVLLYLIFFIHNSIKPRQRIFSFYALYLMKGLVPLVATTPPINLPLIYLLFCVLFSATYLPKYIYLKYKDLRNAEIHPIKKMILQPIIGKNVILLILSFLDINFIFVLIWVDLITMAEFIICRRFTNKGIDSDE